MKREYNHQAFLTAKERVHRHAPSAYEFPAVTDPKDAVKILESFLPKAVSDLEDIKNRSKKEIGDYIKTANEVSNLIKTANKTGHQASILAASEELKKLVKIYTQSKTEIDQFINFERYIRYSKQLLDYLKSVDLSQFDTNKEVETTANVLSDSFVDTYDPLESSQEITPIKTRDIKTLLENPFINRLHRDLIKNIYENMIIFWNGGVPRESDTKIAIDELKNLFKNRTVSKDEFIIIINSAIIEAKKRNGNRKEEYIGILETSIIKPAINSL